MFGEVIGREGNIEIGRAREGVAGGCSEMGWKEGSACQANVLKQLA